jgi:signal transduction histidine kinase
MLRLVHDLLDVAAIEEGRLVVAPAADDPAALIAETIDAYRLTACAKHVLLETDVSPSLPYVRADHERLLQALGNLISNAVKFTSPGGRVRLQATQVGSGVRFSVGDTGPGIAASELPRIFDRFWRANGKDRTSRGLGLAIARGIVEAHGGTITVRSQPGVGSEFAFTIPACQRRDDRATGPSLELPTGRHDDAVRAMA